MKPMETCRDVRLIRRAAKCLPAARRPPSDFFVDFKMQRTEKTDGNATDTRYQKPLEVDISKESMLKI